MKKIQTFSIKELRNEEDFGFHLTVLEETKSLPGEEGSDGGDESPDDPEEDRPVVQSEEPAEGETPALKAAITAHATAVTELDTALKESVAMESVANTDAADAERDNAWSVSYAYVKAMASHPDAEIRTAAEELYKLFVKYGNPTKLSQTEESGVLHNLIQDLKAVDTAKIELVAFAPWLNLIETTANAYLNAARARTNEKAARVTGLVKDARKAADDAFRFLTETVNGHCLVFGDAPYATFIDHLNILIDDQKTILKTRKTNAAKKKEDEPTEDETTPDSDVTPETPSEPEEDRPEVQ